MLTAGKLSELPRAPQQIEGRAKLSDFRAHTPESITRKVLRLYLSSWNKQAPNIKLMGSIESVGSVCGSLLISHKRDNVNTYNLIQQCNNRRNTNQHHQNMLMNYGWLSITLKKNTFEQPIPGENKRHIMINQLIYGKWVTVFEEAFRTECLDFHQKEGCDSASQELQGWTQDMELEDQQCPAFPWAHPFLLYFCSSFFHLWDSSLKTEPNPVMWTERT